MLLLISLICTSCDVSDDQQSLDGDGDESRTVSEVVESSGSDDRLKLVYIERRIEGWDESGWDFHSIVWERRKEEVWEEVKRISREEFEAAVETDRWVSQLHSFDAEDASAIIQIGEMDRHDDAGAKPVQYSWREWHIETNLQLRHFYDITHRELFNAFDPNRNSE
jgi:hypothetical protein